MNANWQELLCRMADGDELTEAEARALAEALADNAARLEAARWLAFEEQLRRKLDGSGQVNVDLSRERLLAKALLREKAGQRSPASRRRMARRVVVAAAAVVVAVALWWLVADRYPAPRCTGEFRIVRAGTPVERTERIGRGDQITVGPGGAELELGGYCRLKLGPQARLMVAGEARKEVIELESGTAESRVDPARGRFRIRTIAGSIDVVGTEFVTTVDVREDAGGTGMGAMGRKLSAVVTVAVITGAVVCHFGEGVVELGAGQSYVFAAEGGVDDVPDGLKGFQGMMAGTIVSKQGDTFVLKVAQVTKVWKNNKAEEPKSAVGKALRIDIYEKSRLAEQHRQTLRGLNVGDRVVVEAFHFEGNRLSVVEELRKAE